MSNLKNFLALALPIVFAACTDRSPVTPLDAASVDRPLFSASAAHTHPTVTISVNDLTTGQPISEGQTVAAGDQFQVSITVTGVDCAGQFVVTALGAPPSPPSDLVQFLPFIIGPAVGNNSVVGGVLTANGLNGGRNDWKVSVSCNGAVTNQFAFDRLQFSAQ
jgi:hypothetical protein